MFRHFICPVDFDEFFAAAAAAAADFGCC